MAELRVNVILLGIICGVAAALFFGRSYLLSPATAEKEPDTGTQEIQETAVKPDPGTSSELLPAPIAVTAVDHPVPSVNSQNPAPSAASTVAPSAKPLVATSIKPPASSVKPSTKSPAATSSSHVKPLPASLSINSRRIEKPLSQDIKGRMVIVLDDAGYNLSQLEPFLKLPFPCAIAVLPGLKYSREAADRIREAGKTVLLHQPMQALDLSIDPGPGAIQKGMSPEQIKDIVRKNLKEVGPVAGINNHEGSLITADRQSMEALLDVVREEGIFFLDSRTNSDTIVPVVAREKKMQIWERAVFLDNRAERTFIVEAVNSGLKIAERKGSAIMIGHIWSNNLADILMEMYPELISQGFSLSTIAELATSGDFDE